MVRTASGVRVMHVAAKRLRHRSPDLYVRILRALHRTGWRAET